MSVTATQNEAQLFHLSVIIFYMIPQHPEVLVSLWQGFYKRHGRN